MNKKISELNVCEAILASRPVFAYKPQKVNVKTVRSVIEAAIRAPTATYLEPWAFVIIQNVELLKRISDTAKAKLIKEPKNSLQPGGVLNQPELNVFYKVSTLIVICANTNVPYAETDCWMAAQNLMLAAHAIGLGSSVVIQALTALSDSEIKSQLWIGEGYKAVVPIVVGYADAHRDISQIKRPLILSWLEG